MPGPKSTAVVTFPPMVLMVIGSLSATRACFGRLSTLSAS